MLGSCSGSNHAIFSLKRSQAPRGAFHLMTTGFLSDLRWNNVGLLGGRALVNCLPSNRTLWRLELAGNSIPSDVLRAAGTGAWGCQQFAPFGARHEADFL